MTKKIDRYVFELWVGIVAFGIICEAAVFFVQDKAIYSLCLAIGVLSAAGAAYHMWWSIDRALDAGEGGAAKSIRIQFILRYLSLACILGIMGLFFESYVLGTFAGIAGLKVAAYAEPLSKKLANLVYGEEILPEKIEYLYEDEEIKEPVEDTGVKEV